MLARVDNFFEDTNKRLSVSFAVILCAHILLIYGMKMSAVMQQEKAKLITSVELLEIEKPKPLSQISVQEEPKNVWEKIKQAIPIGKGDEEPASSPADAMKQLLQETARPPKLVDRTEPLSQLEQSKLDDLKAQRDEMLNDLKDLSAGQQQRMAKLMVQEAALTDAAKPIARPSMGIDNAISMEEVGMKKADNIADIVKTNSVQKASSLKSAPVSQLVEKKAELKKQLAALSALGSGSKLEDRGGASRPGAQLKEVIGSMEERKKAQDLIAIQKLIEAKEPTKPVTSGVGSGGGFGFGSGGGAGLAAAKEAIKFNEPKELPVSKAAITPTPDVIAKIKQAAGSQTVAEIKKAPVEISGPLEKRKVLAAFVPQYPAWARKQGVEADVSLRFFVDPPGKVTSDISVVITSGYRELDQLCIESLKKWTFAPLGAGEPQVDQWGIITIRFRLD